MTEEKMKQNRFEEPAANRYNRQGPVGSSTTTPEVKKSSESREVKMADPEEIMPPPKPVKMADPREIIPVPEPVETDDHGQDYPIPPTPEPREYSDYDFYVASVWQKIEREAGLHVSYGDKAKILRALTGAEPPDPEVPPAPKCPKGQHLEVDMDCVKETWELLNLNMVEQTGTASTLAALGGTGPAEAAAARQLVGAMVFWQHSTYVGAHIGCTKCFPD